MAVTIGRHIHHQRNVEAWPSIYYCLGIFGHTAIQIGKRRAAVKKQLRRNYRRRGTGRSQRSYSDPPAFFYCLRQIPGHDWHIPADSGDNRGIFSGSILGFAIVMLDPFCRHGIRSPYRYFDCPAKSVISCPLKMCQTDEHVRIHDGPADFRFLNILSPRTGTAISSVPLQTISNQDGATHGQRVNPFSQAQYRCSNAFLRLPGYSVLQSVKNGWPPSSFTTSATAFA